MSTQPNNPVPGKPVMADVARLAGVSHQTHHHGDQRDRSASGRPPRSASSRRSRSSATVPTPRHAALVRPGDPGSSASSGTNDALYGPSSIQPFGGGGRPRGQVLLPDAGILPLVDLTREALHDSLDHLAQQSVETVR